MPYENDVHTGAVLSASQTHGSAPILGVEICRVIMTGQANCRLIENKSSKAKSSSKKSSVITHYSNIQIFGFEQGNAVSEVLKQKG
jgi:hypothetical protein